MSHSTLRHGPLPRGGVVVSVHASQGIRARYRRCPMMIEFAPGMRYQLRPGVNEFVLPVGVYRAMLWSQYTFMAVATTQLIVDTTGGRDVRIHYVAPMSIYGQARCGYGPAAQDVATASRTGFRLRVAMVAVFGLVCVAALVMFVATAAQM